MSVYGLWRVFCFNCTVLHVFLSEFEGDVKDKACISKR